MPAYIYVCMCTYFYLSISIIYRERHLKFPVSTARMGLSDYGRLTDLDKLDICIAPNLSCYGLISVPYDNWEGWLAL